MYPLWVMVLVSLMPSLENVCGVCTGLGTSTVHCTALALTEFPFISSDEAALIETLDLSRNQLTSIRTSDLKNFTRLQELDIEHNAITVIEEGSFSTNSTLTTVMLSHNPLHCNCELRWLAVYLNTLAEQSGATCDSPSELTGSLLSNISLSQLRCDCTPVCSENSTCSVFGHCECSPGYSGDDCSQMCSEGLFGLNCNESCSCGLGSCHHITGECSCPSGYLGTNCSHNCTGAPDCSQQGRDNCSLDTPENKCGPHKIDSVSLTTTYSTMSQLVTPTAVLFYTFSSLSSFYDTSKPTPTSQSSATDDSDLSELEIIILSLGLVLFIVVTLTLITGTLLVLWKQSLRRKQKTSPLMSENAETIPMEGDDNKPIQSH